MTGLSSSPDLPDGTLDERGALQRNTKCCRVLKLTRAIEYHVEFVEQNPREPIRPQGLNQSFGLVPDHADLSAVFRTAV